MDAEWPLPGGTGAGAVVPPAAGRLSHPAATLPGMSTYNAAATVILDNGRELPVTARLYATITGHRTRWGGTLATPGNQTPIELYNLAQGRLRLDNGREGAFIRPDISDWMESSSGLFQMMIEGNGDEPF